MSSRTKRDRVSSASSPLSSTTETIPLEHALTSLNSSLDEQARLDVQLIAGQIEEVRLALKSCPQAAYPKDAFRRMGGFPVLLRTLRAYSGYYHVNKRTLEEKELVFRVLECVLCTLGDLFREHHGNRRYFDERVDGGGWSALEQAIASIGLGGVDCDAFTGSRLFGALFAFATDDPSLQTLYQAVQRQCGMHEPHEGGSITSEMEQLMAGSINTTTAGETDLTPKICDPLLVAPIDSALDLAISDKSAFVNPEICSTIIGFWQGLPRMTSSNSASVSYIVIRALRKISSLSRTNLLALHSIGILSILLPLAFEGDNSLAPAERLVVRAFCRELITLGIGDLSDARYLIKSKASEAKNFLLEASKVACDPPHVQFDLSLKGHASIELRSLGRPFPSLISAGYTISLWIRVECFDPNVHTTLFGAFDSTQTCFVLAYLEKDTKNFILQTSVTSSRPSVRFKSTMFKENHWYHVAVVHRRAKAIIGSKALLYVDGCFVEQIKCQYPAQPGNSSGSTDSFASFGPGVNRSSADTPTQVFLGTPQDLSTDMGHGLIRTRWSLASAHLFDDALSDDFLAVHFRLGPRYEGNFQDCLGSFQTYAASAALGMQNEVLHPEKEDKSDILVAIREKASILLPESHVLLSILPSAIFDDKSRSENKSSLLLQDLSKSALTKLCQLNRHTGAAVAINAAIPRLNEALTRTSGTCFLTGAPIVVVPQRLDSAMWRLGGCTSICLKLIEDATSREGIVQAVEILFENVKESWRNSEALERDNGYAILATLLRKKIIPRHCRPVATPDSASSSNTIDENENERLGFQLLSLVLGFVGYDHQVPENSIINNPLAFRILLVDFDIWRKAGIATQKLYYRQFVVFGSHSKYHHFNSRRLIRMRVVKKLIDALKAESFQKDIRESLMEALKTLVKANLSTEVFRSLALFITYALHRRSQSVLAAKSSQRATVGSFDSMPSAIMDGTPIIGIDDDGKARGSVLTKNDLAEDVLCLYADLICEMGNTSNVKKFATTVTNKWLLYLLTETSPQTVINGTKILARLLVTHGSSYVAKFVEKTGGFTVMRHRLMNWWEFPKIWLSCFSILFGRDVAEIDFDSAFSTSYLLQTFLNQKISYAAILPVMMAMIQQGVMILTSDHDHPKPLTSISSASETANNQHSTPLGLEEPASTSQTTDKKDSGGLNDIRRQTQAATLNTVVEFLAEMHHKSQNFKDFAIQSEYVRYLLNVLYPIVVGQSPCSPETELSARDSVPSYDGEAVFRRPLSRVYDFIPPIVRTTTVASQLADGAGELQAIPNPRSRPLRRASSFILLTAKPNQTHFATSHIDDRMTTTTDRSSYIGNALVQAVLELVMIIFLDQMLARKEFPGFGLFLKVPPGLQEHQALLESYVLRNTMSRISHTIKIQPKLLQEPKIITNMARFCLHACEAVYEGWFLDGAEPLMEFSGELLEYLERPAVASIKTVRLCSQAVASIRNVFLKTALLRLSEIDDDNVAESDAITLMRKLAYWQTVLLANETNSQESLRLICYQLYLKLVGGRPPIRLMATNLWRILLAQKPDETAAILTDSLDRRHLVDGFRKLMELDDEAFLAWIDEYREELDAVFLKKVSQNWQVFVDNENLRTEETSKNRVFKRKDKLKLWQAEFRADDDVLFRHQVNAEHWMKNIYGSEHLKFLRNTQDQQDQIIFLETTLSKMNRELQRPCAVFESYAKHTWKLDRTEGPNRMRLRMLPDRTTVVSSYQPKGKAARTASSNTSGNKLLKTKLVTSEARASRSANIATADSDHDLVGTRRSAETQSADLSNGEDGDTESSKRPDEDFELIDDPNASPVETYEDKNRKVMRSLQRGDQVQHVFNISRIIGLEACEGLAILGKEYLYLVDNVFQRSDGEIVNVWQAPSEERDPYLQMIAGQKQNSSEEEDHGIEQETRSWRWDDVISVSKRRFLFRDVAIELFFTDGRSYLLTSKFQPSRDELYQRLTTKAPHLTGTVPLPSPENAWRLEALKVDDELPAGFGSKFGSMFNSSAWNPAMRRWAKGDISNFHYLMLVNAMAGRTFNDLTQYPVFPWIISDYTSTELDLSDPGSFRDLSKPMGAQHAIRQHHFKDRYKSFAEMGGQPPFHYGTHYSSAMIVTSYLIRLQPFVQSYLLLQGGTFDHPDRLFYSIEKTWTSAAKDNMTDVRELIPEFFYLPDFLTNQNGFDFGLRQGNGGSIDDVSLPPWAKGDPKIFIAKNREALESPYVSQHLHEWIDLVFGSKQRGEAAIENTNVFHHLSYHGASNLDEIEDPVERLATIGIIHNFGQTPDQVFSRPHQSRMILQNNPKRLDAIAESLTRLPFPIIEKRDSISTLLYSVKLERLICTTPMRLSMPPSFDKVVEWGFADNSVRFFGDDHQKLIGLVENTHQGQLTAASIADSKTLITAGQDCVVTAWTIHASNKKQIELQPRTSLFGHKTPVRIIEVSRAFSTILSASVDGQALIWDLNRLEFVRKLAQGRHIDCAKINDVSGDILLCRGQKATLYTLNGELILEQDICHNQDDHIHCCAFYEGAGNEWLENTLVFTGHSHGIAKVWKKVIRDDGWTLDLVKRLDHVDVRMEDKVNTNSAITCIKAMPNVVYTGDDSGRVYQWNCIQREK